jgi:hypothetical protein
VYRPIPVTLVRSANISRRVGEHGSLVNPAFLAWIALLGFLCAATAGPARAQSQVDEYRVKAAFLYHFAQLVDWPAGALRDASQPLILCTIGDDPFHGELENSVDGKVVDGRFIRIRHLKKIQEAHACQILLFGKEEEDKQLADILMELGNGPILTVGESDQFAQQGGMIQFILDDSKVRFDINVGAAQKSALKISSKLLLLAKEVIGNRGGK